jgi:hypothetical protein
MRDCPFLFLNVTNFIFVNFCIGMNYAIFVLKKSDTMGERMGRIRRIGTDFFDSNAPFQA